jgi:2-C-methyl-D-erythritol 4-phosphate cytidylyltransferase
MPAAAKYWAVVPAAGAGRRMAADVPKQYLDIDGKTVLEHSLEALLSSRYISAVVVVIAADDERWPLLQSYYHGRPLTTVTGGTERCHSVLKGLDQLAQTARNEDWVLVHDAARPCLAAADIETLIDSVGDDAVGGLLGVPVADTMKRVDADGLVEQTVARAGLWHALTPQMFRLGLLRTALQQSLAAGRLVTDEAAAMEFAGHRPRMVQGRRDNIKITLPADLALAEFYLQARAAE